MRREGTSPVDADSSEIEYRRGTAHDIEGHPRIAHDVTQFPLAAVYLTPNNNCNVIIIVTVIVITTIIDSIKTTLIICYTTIEYFDVNDDPR